MEIEDLLNKLGLSKKESSVYMTLLKNGSMTVGSLSKESGINRPAIYKLLPDLQKQGLVVLTPYGKQKKYTAEPPNKLKTLIDDLKFNLLEKLPDLESIYELKDKKPDVKFFKGKDGIGQIFMDVANSLERKGTYYRYTASEDLKKIDKYIPKEFRIIRDRKELEAVIISSKSANEQKWVHPNRVIKYIPDEFDLFDQGVTMFIYAEKISIIDYSSELGIIIENKKITEFQKKLFKFIYQKL
ncbi:MAG: helix-turn-helix domain-containing protein [Nitrospira sp.]